MKRENLIWIEQLSPVIISSGISYVSGTAGQIIGLGGGILIGGITAKQLGHFFRRQNLRFAREAFESLKILIEKAEVFHATSIIPFEDWISPFSFYYLTLQGISNIRKEHEGKNFDFVRIFLLTRNREKYVESDLVGDVLALHRGFGLTRLLYHEIQDSTTKKNLAKHDFSFIEVNENNEKAEIIIEPDLSKKWVSIKTFWSKNIALKEDIRVLGVQTEIDSATVKNRKKELQELIAKSNDFLAAMRKPVDFFDR